MNKFFFFFGLKTMRFTSEINTCLAKKAIYTAIEVKYCCKGGECSSLWRIYIGLCPRMNLIISFTTIFTKIYLYHFDPLKPLFYSYIVKKIREKSRECHNHKPQPFPDPKRKRKPTNLNKHKPNKRTKSTKIRLNWGLQGYTLFFLFLLRNIQCGYSLESHPRGNSNGYPQSMF